MGGYSDRITGWWEEVRARDAGRTYILKDGKGNPLCATLAVWDSHTMYCLINGMLETMRDEGHLNMLLFERMITDAMDAGLDFDFLGSDLLGVERFIRGWGGELRHYFRVIKVPSPLAYTGWKAYSYFKLTQEARPAERGLTHPKRRFERRVKAMCGIVGYIGEKNAVPILLEGLKKLEYRGYDSAGIAFLQDGSLGVRRRVGKLEEPRVRHSGRGLHLRGRHRAYPLGDARETLRGQRAPPPLRQGRGGP